MADYDLIGSIAIIKPAGKTRKEKLQQAEKILKRKNIKTVVEKADRVKGRLRTINVNHVKGIRNTITEHKENSCVFRMDLEKCYFSPRLSEERKLIAGKIKKKDSVLVMFAGIGVYPIVINKISKARKIVGIELGRSCCKYFKENLKLNKMENKIEVVQGNVKRKITGREKFDVVVMPRPNLKESFLKYGLKASKKNTRIFYYAFCRENEINNVKKQLIEESKRLRRNIKVNKIIKAGDIAPRKYRYRIEIKVLK